VSVFARIRRHKVVRYSATAAAITILILLVFVVGTLTIDLGPAVRALAERQASVEISDRPVHIGSLRILVGRGVVEVRDFSIEGLHPGDRPFFTAKRLLVNLDWSRVLRRHPQVVITSVELTDWQMLVEKWSHADNFPSLRKRESSGKPSTEGEPTAILRYLRAWRGMFSYEDHEAPWSVIAPNMDINIDRAAKYEGEASFHGGEIAIQDFVPMWADLKTRFIIDGSLLHMTKVDIDTDGAKSAAAGDVDLGHFPEMRFAVKSHLPSSQRMREIFFASEPWKLTGGTDFAGSFHLFRGGHDLVGDFKSDLFGLYDYRFPKLYGSLHWTDKLFDITDGGSHFYGGTSKFAFSTAPLGTSERALDRFEFRYSNVDLARFTDFEEMPGQRFAGIASGRNSLEWHSGRFGDEHHGDGTISVAPLPGVQMMAETLEPRSRDAQSLDEWGPFTIMPLSAHLPIAGEMTYEYDPKEIRIRGGRFTTEKTFVTFDGSTAWGDAARMPFHVTSRDWQESDQLLAGIISDFGSKSHAVAVGGSGRFDGVLTGPFRSPRVEGDVVGEDIRAWDTLWGDGEAHIVVQNEYVDVADGIVRHNGSEIRTDGRFALGYPRSDHGEEIDARFRATGRDVDSLRHAFAIDDYPVSGDLTGEFHLSGMYQHVIGFGTMTIEDGTAYDEPFEHATASLRFDGAGVRLDGASLRKGAGAVTGAAYIGWDATYSFNAEGRGIPVADVQMFAYPDMAPTGSIDFTAGGSGPFDTPRYNIRFRVHELAVAGEPLGDATGSFAVLGRQMSGQVDAASPRFAVSGTGRLTLFPHPDSDLTFRFHDFTFDPYLRVFVPTLPPDNTAVASGTLHVTGALNDFDALAVDGTVDSLNMQFFDYGIRSTGPVRIALDHQTLRIDELNLAGVNDDTRLRVGGTVNLRDERIAAQATGDANLGILQGFFRDVRGSGRAELVAGINGPLREPLFSGSARITNGRLRHFALPNSLDSINGTIQFDSRGIRLDDLRATMADGPVQFGGRVGFEGYLPGDLDLTIRGERMHLRVPQGVRSTVDADLALRGNVNAATLAGSIVVRSATFAERIDPTGGLLDFGRRGGGGDVAVPEAGPTVPVRFDVELLVPSSLRIDNNLAHLVASADLQLRGTYDHPQLFGRAEVDRGDVTFEGRRYVVTKGSADFTNPTRIEPFFDIEAETRVRVPGETYRVTIQMTGTTSQLQPTLSSDPPLPSTTDILALLFGDVRNPAFNTVAGDVVELNALKNPNERQTDILTTRATQLLASPLSSQVGRVVEQTFGIDTFQLSPSLFDPYSQTTSTRVNPTARVIIGKRLSDRVYLTFSRSLSSSTNDQIILLEYDATDRFSWILSRNEGQTYALEVSMRHAF
jgi:translocation and assembly module TamB